MRPSLLIRLTLLLCLFGMSSAFSQSNSRGPRSDIGTLSATTPVRAVLPTGAQLQLGNAQATLAEPGGTPVVLSGLPQADRRGTSVTVVPDGRVLIFGGLSSDGRLLTQAHWFDVASKSFKPATEELPPARAGHAALVLTDGRVLFAGGVDARLSLIEGAQLWDPRSGAITALARDALVDRVGATATLLTDGHVLDRRRTRSPGSSHACSSAAH